MCLASHYQETFLLPGFLFSCFQGQERRLSSVVMNADQAFGFATPSLPIAIKNLNYNVANVIIILWFRDIHDENFKR